MILEYECGTTDSSDCTSEYENSKNNNNLQSFYDRCSTEGGSEPLRLRCSLCCTGNQKLKLLNGNGNGDWKYIDETWVLPEEGNEGYIENDSTEVLGIFTETTDTNTGEFNSR